MYNNYQGHTASYQIANLAQTRAFFYIFPGAMMIITLPFETVCLQTVDTRW